MWRRCERWDNLLWNNVYLKSVQIQNNVKSAHCWLHWLTRMKKTLQTSDCTWMCVCLFVRVRVWESTILSTKVFVLPVCVCMSAFSGMCVGVYSNSIAITKPSNLLSIVHTGVRHNWFETSGLITYRLLEAPSRPASANWTWLHVVSH